MAQSQQVLLWVWLMGVQGCWEDFFSTQLPSLGKMGLENPIWVCGWAEMPPRMFDRFLIRVLEEHG